ncbi:MAG: hypothetical protein J6X06_04730, partial [Elusimicrobiaceae bacterium]|nr:hypothetical protein [Elusimicrobiaceae bacterium]
MDPKQLTSFKLAGLRAGHVAQATAQSSSLVRAATKLHQGRKTAKRALKYFFKSLKSPKISAGNKLRVLLHVRGGIGDVCMARIFIQKLRATLPQAEISFSYDTKEVVDLVFPDGLIDRFEPTNYLPQQSDIVLSGCHLLMYDFINRQRVEKLAPHFLPILEQGLDVQAYFKPFAVYSPYLDGQLAEIAVVHGGSRITNLGWFSGLEVHQNDLSTLTLDSATTDNVLKKYDLTHKIYVTIHDGINTRTDTSLGHPTRCWPQAKWMEFANLFKATFPDICLVQLGGSKSHPFSFVDQSLVGKTALADLPH